MLSVKEVSELAGVSVRTLHHYDRIGLLRPTARTGAGYRLYGDNDLARLQQILLLRELEFPLAEIRSLIDSPTFNRRKALEQQIGLLELKRERIDRLIGLARSLTREDVTDVSFEAFDTSRLDEYAQRAKESWGDTATWKDYERRSAGRTREEDVALGEQMMQLFTPFGQMAAEGADPASDAAKAQARIIQQFISEHYYACSDAIFAQLGRAYGAGGEFTDNINAAAGPGAAEFAARAVEAWCAQE